MASQTKTRVLGRYIERSIALGLALSIPAVGLLVAAAFVSGPLGVVLASIGSTLGTVALLSFLYDPFLKDILAAEIFERVGLRDSVVRAGLRDIGRARDFELQELVGLSRSLSVLPLDPVDWPRDEFQHVLSVATRQPLQVRLYLPGPDDTPSLRVLADRLDLGFDELARRLRQLPDDLVGAWDDAGPHADSTLEVFQFEGAPAAGLLLCDACAVLEAGPSLRHAPLDRTTSAFVYEANSGIATWIATQLRFPREGTAPTPAGVRPITPPAELPGRHATAPEAAPVGAAAEGSAAEGGHEISNQSAETQTASQDPPERQESRHGE